MSPASMAAQGHMNLWAPNFGIQEYLELVTAERDALFPSEHYYESGVFHITDAPGLSVDFDEKESERYSYKRTYHPVVRLEDGTMWNY